MVLVSLLCLMTWQTDALQFVKPIEPTFAGKVEVQLRTSVPEDDILGLEVFVNNQQAHYFEEAPFKIFLDMSAHPNGKVEIRAVLETFDETVHTAIFEGQNVRPDVTENVSLVRVPVLANIPGVKLGKNDFIVKEDGKQQDIQMVLGQEKSLYIVAVLDLSTSMKSRLGLLRSAMNRLLDQVRPGDVVHVIGFNHRVFEVCEPQSDMDIVRKRLMTLQAKGDTNLYGGLFSGIKILGHSQERRALILFTDGDHWVKEEADNYKQDQESCIKLAQEKGVPIYTVGFGAGVNRDVLSEISEASGGHPFFSARPKKLTEAFAQIAEELHHQYLLCYYTSTKRPGEHKIDVSVRNKDLTLMYPKRLYIKR